MSIEVLFLVRVFVLLLASCASIIYIFSSLSFYRKHCSVLEEKIRLLQNEVSWLKVENTVARHDGFIEEQWGER